MHTYIIAGQILFILIMLAMNAAMGIDGLWLSFGAGFALGNLVNALIVLVRLFLDGDDIVLRIRHNCEKFDMTDTMYRQTGGDAFSNVGIRLVYGISKDIRYVNILSTNTLIITI